jgi:hypothetical protein
VHSCAAAAVQPDRVGSHKPFKVKQVFQTVAVTGRLRAEVVRNDLASASYILEATHVGTTGRPLTDDAPAIRGRPQP